MCSLTRMAGRSVAGTMQKYMARVLQVQFFLIDPAEDCGVDSVTVETVLTNR